MAPVRLEARLVDITTLGVDAIVNAANTALAPGGGVCGAIHRAAGPELAVACARVAPCPTGDARITPGFRLPARFVIHAVGPVWQGGDAGEPELLASAYRASLHLAANAGLASIAFPAISTGIYGYPIDQATVVAVTAVRAALAEPGSITQVLFGLLQPGGVGCLRCSRRALTRHCPDGHGDPAARPHLLPPSPRTEWAHRDADRASAQLSVSRRSCEGARSLISGRGSSRPRREGFWSLLGWLRYAVGMRYAGAG